MELGIFQTEYAFEAAIQNAVCSAHDGHVNLVAGALAVFKFGSSHAISSVSADGIGGPRMYLTGLCTKENPDHKLIQVQITLLMLRRPMHSGSPHPSSRSTTKM